ncbi:MAG: mechanosensitive ion channel [Burkholderiales bacterium]
MNFTGFKCLEIFFCMLLLMAAFSALQTHAAAQEPTESGKQETRQIEGQGQGEQPEKSSSDEADDAATITGAERLNRLEQTIKLDQAKLIETRKQLAEQTVVFDDVKSAIERFTSEIAEKKKKLEEVGGPDASQEALSLATEIRKLEEQQAIRKSELELRFKAGKTLRNQIRALEQKIANDQKALDNLVNPQATLPKAPESETSAAPAGEALSPSAPSPTQVIVPGTATTPTRPGQPSQATEPETAEQIEARKEAEQLEAEAQLAEQELVSFVERKQALDDQIEIEQTLLDTAEASRQNIDAALDQLRADAATLIEQGASKAEIRTVQGRINSVEQLQRQNRADIDQRREYLDSLYKRRKELDQERLAVTEQVESKRKKAGKARKRSVWLESPLHPRNLWAWVLERGPRILMVLVVAWALLALVRFSSRRIARTLVAKVGDGTRQRGTNRADTLALSFQSASTLIIIVAATLLAFQEAGVDIKTVLGGAAILGVAFAFGAQNLMRDYFAGFMIVLEDQYELGDLITVGAVTGIVEKVNMRTTVLRDLEGRVHFIPNGEIKSVTNRTYVWGRAVLEIPVGFKEDADRVMTVIREVEEEFRTDPEFNGWVTDDPVMLGVDKFTEYGMIIKTFVQTQPDKIFQTRRELLRRIKNRFDEEGIEISVPQRMLLQAKST